MKNHIKNELAKLKPMTFAEKREYLFEYYRIHLFVIIFIGLFTYAVIDAVYLNPRQLPYLGVAIYGPYVSFAFIDEKEAWLTDAIMPREIIESKSQKIYITDFLLSEFADPTIVSANHQRFAAMSMAGELDIIIADEDYTMQFAASDALIDLSSIPVVFPEDAALRRENEDGVSYPVVLYRENEDGSSYPIGIAIDRDFFAGQYLEETALYISVIINAQRILPAVSAINLILSEPKGGG